MNTELIDIGENKFLKIPVMPISQKNKNFYLAKMPARFLIDKETGQATPQETTERKNVSGDELKELSAYTDFINTLDMEDFDKGSQEE